MAILSSIGTGSGGFLSGSFIGFNTSTASASYSTAITDTNSGANIIGIKKFGSNTLTLSGANTFSGMTYIVAGTLTIASPNAASPNSSINIASGATLNINSSATNTVPTITGTGTVSNAVTTTGFKVGDATNFTWGGDWSAGTLSKYGSGKMTITATNSSTSAKTVAEGTLQIGNGGTTGSLASGSITISSGATLSINRSDNYALINVLAGTGNVTNDGPGKTTLSANTTSNTGTLTINSGSVEFTTTGTTITFGSIVDNSALIFNASTARNFSNVISGSGTLQISNAGAVTLTGNNTYSGITTIDSGSTLILGTSSSGTLGSGSVTNDGTIRFVRSSTNTYIVSNVISGSGNMQYTASTSGGIIITGNNTYTGTTSNNGSSALLVIGNGGTTGTLGSGKITVGSSCVLRFNRTDNITIANDIDTGQSGGSSGTIQIVNTGTVVFTGTINNIINPAVMAVNAGGALGGTSNFSTNMGTTTLSNSSSIFGGTGSGNAGTLTIRALTFSGGGNRVKVYSDGSNLSKVECGSSTITSATNTTVDFMDVCPTGTYTLVATTGTKPTSTLILGTNNSTRSVTLSWVAGVGLRAVLI